jgi:hypothetical protein
MIEGFSFRQSLRCILSLYITGHLVQIFKASVSIYIVHIYLFQEHLYYCLDLNIFIVSYELFMNLQVDY